MTVEESEPSEYESLAIDDEGFIRLVWPSDVRITGPAARAALRSPSRP